MLTLTRELPWERLTLAHLGYSTLIQIALVLVAVYFLYASMVPEKTRGALVMRPELKHPNYPFYFVAAGWVGLLWLTLSRISRDFQFWDGTNFPREFVEDMMMQSVVSTTFNFTLYFIWGLLILRTMFHRQEIWEKGLKNGTGFFLWEFIDHGRWIGPGEIRVYYRVPKRRFLFLSAGKESFEEEPASFLWEMKPDQEPEVRRELEKFLH